jgi:alkylated DNA repair dioxygenase AlkB
MVFDGAGAAHEQWLDPRSLLVMTGYSRQTAKHSIAGRKSDTRVVAGRAVTVKRARSVSVTFRTMAK